MRTVPTLLPCGVLILLAIAATGSVASPDNTLVKAVATAQADQDGRILLSPFRVANTSLDGTGVTLARPPVSVPFSAYKADPTLRDEVKILLTPEVVAQLKNLGITDATAHFKGKTLQVRGKRTSVIYFCFPAIQVYTVTVDRLQDLIVTSSLGKS